ncbi:hypothetical protein [Paraherbaspirillum soli]|uniref:DUF3592 domain-containing protein n=1 Tax=Paraherbaspirillum soli TaxID=631222 RepID=A0ABW0MF59_9BURK
MSTSSSYTVPGHSFLTNARQVYKWATLPLLLIGFFCCDGWTSMRVAWDGYEQTTGALTHCREGRYGTLEYSYAVNSSTHHNTIPNLEACRSHVPGEHAVIYYSTLHPDLSVANVAPAKAFREALKTSLKAALLFPALLVLAISYKNLFE